MKLKVKPEGREGVWLAEKEDVVDFLLQYEEDTIHNFIPGCGMMLGADWDKEGVIRKVNEAERIAILTGDPFKSNMRHALSVIADNELFMFDIGDIENDLVVE